MNSGRFIYSERFRSAARRIVRELLICVVLPSGLLIGAELVAQKAAETPSQQQYDNQLAASINSQIQASGDLRPLDLGVSVSDGVATLSGTAPTSELRQQAEDLAQGVLGVRSVDDKITVGTPSATAPGYSADETNPQQQSPGMAPPPPPQGQQQPEQSGPENDGNMAPPPPPGSQNQGYDQNFPPPPPPGSQNQGYDQNGPPPPPPSGSEDQGYSQNGTPLLPPQGDYPNSGPPPSRPQQAYQNPGPHTMVTVAPGTPVTVMMLQGVNSKHTKPGTPFRGVLVRDVVLPDGIVAIPRGAYVHGMVIDSRGPGHLKGHPKLALQLTNLDMTDTSYVMTSNIWDRRGPGKGAQTTGNVVGSAAVGATVGGIVGGGPTALLGAALGGLGGAGLSSLSSGPRLIVPAESVFTFYLNAPVTVREPTTGEIRSLAGNVPYSGNGYGPRPYVGPGYGPPPGYPPPPGGYPY